MKIDEMNIVITGANGALASYLLEYFSSKYGKEYSTL